MVVKSTRQTEKYILLLELVILSNQLVMFKLMELDINGLILLKIKCPIGKSITKMDSKSLIIGKNLKKYG